MKSYRLVLFLVAAAQGHANLSTRIDFEGLPPSNSYPQCLLFGCGPTPPLTIGVATFSGGYVVKDFDTLAQQTTGIYPDRTAIYVSSTPELPTANPLTISFSSPVNHFSALVINYNGFGREYLVADDLGDMEYFALDPAYDPLPPALRVSLNFNGIHSVTITELDPNYPASDYSFAIDNVEFTATPEPAFFIPLGMGLAALVARRSIFPRAAP